jgi:hypothetical protein
MVEMKSQMDTKKASVLLTRLRQQFESQGSSHSHLRHLLIVFPDDRDDLALGPKGMSEQGHVHTPDIIGEEIAMHSPQVLKLPKLTAQGQAVYLPLGGFHITADARQAFIAQPGLMATSMFVYEGPEDIRDWGLSEFEQLVADVVRVLRQLGGRVAPHLPEDLKAAVPADATSWWAMLLHELAWDADRYSFLQAKRSTWVTHEGQRATYVDYGLACVRNGVALPPELKKAIQEQVKSPPDHFLSILEKDVFSSSAAAIDVLLTRLASERQWREQSVAVLRFAAKVAVAIFALIGFLSSLLAILQYLGIGGK